MEANDTVLIPFNPDDPNGMCFMSWRDALQSAHRGIQVAQEHRQRVFRAAQAAGLSQRQIAEAVGISAAGVNRIVVPKKRASLDDRAPFPSVPAPKDQPNQED